MHTLKYSIVDAFTSSPFKGNSAPVVILTSPLPDAILQKIAAEFNLSETAFVTPIDPSQGRFGLRWFTPKFEVDLCGHATLASAFTLFSENKELINIVKVVEFETRSGTLSARYCPDGKIELEFPCGKTTPVIKSLELEIKSAINRAFPAGHTPSIMHIRTGKGSAYFYYVIVEIDEVYDLGGADVDPNAFLALAPGHQMIIVTQAGSKGQESFKSRVFAPAAGIPEDPVTGSAHTLLGPYWAARFQEEGKAVGEMLARQVSPRTGEIGINLVGDSKIILRGHGCLMASGELFV